MKHYYLKLSLSLLPALLLISRCANMGPVEQSIRVTSPAAGAVWSAGTVDTIRWTYYGSGGDSVMIGLYNDTGRVLIIAAVAMKDRWFPWKIPLSMPGGARYRITIGDTASDSLFASSGFFSIVNYADGYEVDDSASLATLITTDGTIQYHTLPRNDADWFKFEAHAGTTYGIQTHGTTDTYIELYGTDGRTLLAPNDNGGTGLNAMILWTCVADGIYYFRITGRENANDPAGHYAVDIRAGSALLAIVYPDSGCNFTSGSQVAVQWRYSLNSGSIVSLYAYRNDTLAATIATAAPNNGSFTWVVPHALPTSAAYRIKIVSGDDSSVNNYSDAFAITSVPASFTITAPSAATQWNSGSTYAVSWICSGNPGASARLALYDGDSLVTTIADSTRSAAGSFLWTIPLTLPTASAYRIKITSRSDTAVYDFSDQFTITKIPSALTITAPSSSANWNTGATKLVIWTFSGTPGSTARLALYNGDSLVTNIVNSVSIIAGYYYWTIPWALPTASAYRIKITSINDTSIYDFSDQFSITHVQAITVTSPSTGTSWNAGTLHTIFWNSSSNTPGSYVTIYLCDSTAEIPIPIASDLNRNSGYYIWTLPATLRNGADYLIKIVSTADTSANGYSGPFAIAGQPDRLTITSPTAGTSWIADDYYTIYWSYSGPDLENSYVRLELYDSSTFVDTITASRYTTSGSFLWQVPSTLPSNSRYRIKIASTTLDTVFDFSDSFTITNPALIGDSYEPDDTYEQAKLIAKNDPAQSHTMSGEYDEDWIKFNAVSGTTYTIETQGSTDTQLDLFDTSGGNLLASDDDSGTDYPNAKIVWTCPTTGTYYFMVTSGIGDVGSYTVTLR